VWAHRHPGVAVELDVWKPVCSPGADVFAEEQRSIEGERARSRRP
jgi:hypothetical protein